MSVPAVGWARHQGRIKKLPTFARILLLTLSDILGASGRLCPSIPYLAADTGLSENTVRKFLRVLKDAGLIDWVTSVGNVTHYRLLKPSQPPQDVKGSNGSARPTHARREAVSPARREGVQRVDPLTPCAGPLQMEGVTPSRLEAEPLEPSIEPKTRARTREGSEDLKILEEKEKSPPPRQPVPEREPTPAEIEANRKRQLAELGEFAPLATAMANALFGNYPPRAPNLSVNQMREAVAPPLSRRPFAQVSPEHLAMLRRNAGYARPLVAELAVPP